MTDPRSQVLALCPDVKLVVFETIFYVYSNMQLLGTSLRDQDKAWERALDTLQSDLWNGALTLDGPNQ